VYADIQVASPYAPPFRMLTGPVPAHSGWLPLLCAAIKLSTGARPGRLVDHPTPRLNYSRLAINRIEPWVIVQAALCTNRLLLLSHRVVTNLELSFGGTI
jgi:hypothetical protein